MRDGLKVVLNISKLGNQYIQANKPWVLVKGNDDERYGHQYFLMNVWCTFITFY
jgi:methionyl-tRNA synthetase